MLFEFIAFGVMSTRFGSRYPGISWYSTDTLSFFPGTTADSAMTMNLITSRMSGDVWSERTSEHATNFGCGVWAHFQRSGQEGASNRVRDYCLTIYALQWLKNFIKVRKTLIKTLDFAYFIYFFMDIICGYFRNIRHSWPMHPMVLLLCVIHNLRILFKKYTCRF
jgi:hypothetical protein